MKLGISVKIDVSKIEKSRLYKGQKGTYLDLTTFINTDELDQYENNGFISQTMTKEERETGVEKTPILGNVKVFYTDEKKDETERVKSQSNEEWLDEHSKASSDINKTHKITPNFVDSEEIPF